MHGIGTGFGHGTDRTTTGATIGYIIFIGNDLKLTDGFHRDGIRTGSRTTGDGTPCIHPINSVVGRRSQLTTQAASAAQRRQVDKGVEVTAIYRQLCQILGRY
ncbi:hypothetical protein D3C86_895780 [compost metagenome]